LAVSEALAETKGAPKVKPGPEADDDGGFPPSDALAVGSLAPKVKAGPPFGLALSCSPSSLGLGPFALSDPKLKPDPALPNLKPPAPPELGSAEGAEEEEDEVGAGTAEPNVNLGLFLASASSGFFASVLLGVAVLAAVVEGLDEGCAAPAPAAAGRAASQLRQLEAVEGLLA